MRENKCYKVTDEDGQEIQVWDGRYAAVCGIVFANHEGNLYVLANKRGSGCPDEVGKWNMPCGYLQAGSAESNVAREVFEETGVKIDPTQFEFIGISNTAERRNVTLRYLHIHTGLTELCPVENLEGGEVNEVAEIKWINLLDAHNYDWAFNHLQVMHDVIRDIIIPMVEQMQKE